jgi:hypothetical protein
MVMIKMHGHTTLTFTKRTRLHLRRGRVYRILKDFSLNQVGIYSTGSQTIFDGGQERRKITVLYVAMFCHLKAVVSVEYNARTTIHGKL